MKIKLITATLALVIIAAACKKSSNKAEEIAPLSQEEKSLITSAGV